MSEVITEVSSGMGFITLNRPKALNALSLGMIRDLTATLLSWQNDPQIAAVAIRGQGREGPFGAFCAGGDIRFFHQAALAGNPELEDFFTEEYALNYLVHRFAKPYLVFMDGIVMGGGMGLCGHFAPAASRVSEGAPAGSSTRDGHGGANILRIATERTRMAMPETNIGLFPDVGGGWFLARCPGHVGEYLALTGNVIGGTDACHAGLADGVVSATELPALWEKLRAAGRGALQDLRSTFTAQPGERAGLAGMQAQIDRFFSLDSVAAIIAALEAEQSSWAQETAAVLRKRSPLMLHVALQQVRRARAMSLADELRMERDMVRRCFHLRPGPASETAEGIRALAVDKDHAPRWNPTRIEEVTSEAVAAFFDSPWPKHAHPLRGLG